MAQLHKRALIVDDEEAVREVLSDQLEWLGYRCVAVSSGQKALEKATQQEFDLVVLDMMMPEMSGLEVLKRFRPHHPEACVVMLSAVADASVAGEAINHGADDYLSKPCSLDQLSARLRKAHERRDAARRNGPALSPPKRPAVERADVGQIT